MEANLSLRQDQGGCGSLRTLLRFRQLGPKGGSPARSFGFNHLQRQVIPAHKVCASLCHTAVDLLLDSSLARTDIVLCLGNLALPRLQPIKIKIALGGLQRQRFLTPAELLLLGRRPFQQCKGGLA